MSESYRIEFKRAAQRLSSWLGLSILNGGNAADRCKGSDQSIVVSSYVLRSATVSPYTSGNELNT